MSEKKTKRMAIIAAHGTLDAAYPPMILASTAIAMDMEEYIQMKGKRITFEYVIIKGD